MRRFAKRSGRRWANPGHSVKDQVAASTEMAVAFEQQLNFCLVEGFSEARLDPAQTGSQRVTMKTAPLEGCLESLSDSLEFACVGTGVCIVALK